jgi:hypothetical protein
MFNDLNVNAMLGKTILTIEGSVGSEELIFTCSDGTKYKLYHSQDCGESVSIDDIVGDLGDLIGEPILMSEEVSNDEPGKPNADSFTWTFYKFATVKGYVTIKWYGESNGYYSEGVSFAEVAK